MIDGEDDVWELLGGRFFNDRASRDPPAPQASTLTAQGPRALPSAIKASR
jgi:hypothetical protein